MTDTQTPPTRIVALEEHMFPRDILQAAGLDLGPRAERRADALDDLGAGRLAAMDAAGVDMQVLSALAWIVQDLEPAPAASVSRELNDRMVATVAGHPDRFAAFATLPTSAPELAAAELRRSVEDLGFVGAMIHGQTHGRFLDHPSMAPVLACAEELQVPVYLHPAPPPRAVFDTYYQHLDDDVAAALSTAGWGWHAECGLHVLRMIVAGTFERHPGLQVIVGHMGELLPFGLARADDMLTPVLPSGQRPVLQTAQEHVHITTSAFTTVAPLQCALAVFGADRVMFAVDHPFADSARNAAFLRSMPVSSADREKIGHGNAERLLGLGGRDQIG